jgi:lysophospholipase L1-like esterase
MKNLYVIVFLVAYTTVLYGQGNSIRYVDAAEMTFIGKAMPTPHVYHRLDTVAFKGLSSRENQQARCSAGIALVFRTNSDRIDLHPTYKWEHKGDNYTGIFAGGFDLYIKKDNQWLYARSAAPGVRNKPYTLVENMDTAMKECLLYLPAYSELEDLKIGIRQNAVIAAIPNPFKQKIVFFGSSFTQGTGASRSGMSYPMQIERDLNIHVCNLGFAGNSMLQDYFAKVMAAIDADAFVFDAFSNPTEEIIRERLFTFIDIVREKHQNTPLIFVQTVHRGGANFSNKVKDTERKKQETAEELMQMMTKKYPNVYFVDSPLPEKLSKDTSTDGVHPSDMGYRIWAGSLEKKLCKILKIKK